MNKPVYDLGYRLTEELMQKLPDYYFVVMHSDLVSYIEFDKIKSRLKIACGLYAEFKIEITYSTNKRILLSIRNKQSVKVFTRINNNYSINQLLIELTRIKLSNG